MGGGGRACQHGPIVSQYNETVGKLLPFLLRKSRAKRLAVERGKAKPFSTTVPGEKKAHRAMTEPTLPVVKNRVHLLECPGCEQFGKSGGGSTGKTVCTFSSPLLRTTSE